jgi:hypothetical protein
VRERRKLRGPGHGARRGHGSLPLMAMTSPAKNVATTDATRNPVNPTSTTVRTNAHPRLATRTPALGRVLGRGVDMAG